MILNYKNKEGVVVKIRVGDDYEIDAEELEYAALGAPCPKCGCSITEDGVSWMDENGLCVHCAPTQDDDRYTICEDCGQYVLNCACPSESWPDDTVELIETGDGTPYCSTCDIYGAPCWCGHNQ